MSKEKKKSKTIITSENWKEYRKIEAERLFPIGTEVQCGRSWARMPDYNNFFKVKKITPAGFIVTNKLILEEADRDCDQGGGWIDYDLNKKTLSEEKINFFPFLHDTSYVINKGYPAKWKTDYDIWWAGSQRSGYHSISKIKDEENGLVRAVMGALL